MSTTRPGAIIIGAGPGVSGSVARLCARGGYDVGLVGLDEAVLADLTGELEELGATALATTVDITDADALTAAVEDLAASLGEVRLLHFNPSAYRAADPLSLTAAGLAEDVTLGVGALLTALQAARPAMSAGARITATGSMAADSPDTGAASLGVQKAGLRNLVHAIDAALREGGIRAVSVTVRGVLGRTGAFTPDRVADAIWAAATRPDDDWTAEVSYTG